MAMTKAEKALVDALTKGRDMARALRWPEYPRPAPMTRAEIEAAKSVELPRYGRTAMAAQGWDFNSYNGRIYEVWSDGVSHTTFIGTRDSSSWSQGMGRLFATKLDALRALRLELTEKHAKELAQFDRLIEAEIA